MTIKAYGARAGDTPLESMNIERRAPGPGDVQIEIAYCGVCHSDLHTVRAEWSGTRFPCVPGHEMLNRLASNLCRPLRPAVAQALCFARCRLRLPTPPTCLPNPEISL